MMKGNYIHLWLIILTGIVLLQSCMQEVPGEDVLEDGQLSLRLVVSAPATTTTRAVEATLATLENRIDKLEVLFFANGLCVWHPDSVTYDAVTGSVTIPRPVNTSLIDGTTSYTVWVIANKVLTNMTGDSLNVLKNLLVRDDFLNNGMAPPSPLVMEGSVITTLSAAGQFLGTVTLQRLLAKITIRIKTGSTITPHLNGGYPQVSLQQYKTETSLIDTGIPPENLPLKSDSFIAADSLTTGQWLTTDYPYYSFSHHWPGDPARETFILVKIPQTIDGVTRDHFYKVDFNYQKVDGSAKLVSNYGLERNCFYDLEVFIDQPGGSEEAPLSVTGNRAILNWTTRELYGSITSEIYLSLSEQTIYMDNVDSYTLRYSSSLSGVSVKEITYTGTGAPTFTVTATDATSGTITINSTLPTNYQPRHIFFTITNETPPAVGINVQVEVIQSPPIVISLHTATKSSVYLEPAASLSKNIYLITSAVTTADAGRIVAFPPLDGSGHTVGTTEIGNMVSPRLMLASEIGNNTAMSYADALTYCSGYWESTSAGATYNDWRLPTLEELKLIDQLKDNSAIAPAMAATYYWDARSNGNTYDMITAALGTTRQTAANVRCVRDMKN